MADDAGTRLRNVSDYGDLDVPELGFVIAAKHEVVIADADLAQRLIDTGAFIAVAKPGPKPAADATPPDTVAPADDTTTPTPTGDETDTTTGEEPTSDHAA